MATGDVVLAPLSEAEVKGVTFECLDYFSKRPRWRKSQLLGDLYEGGVGSVRGGNG